MALSGLGPALSGAYANVQRLLLERKLQQEDLDRRRQEALADRQAQWAEEMRRMMLQRQLASEDRAAEARTPEARLARALQVGPHIPGGVDIANYLREMGFPIPPRQVEQGVATVGMPPPGMEGLEAPRPGQILPQQRIAFGGVREEPGRVMVGPSKPFPTLGEQGGTAVRPEFRHIPWDPSKPIPEQYLLPKPKEKERTISVVISGQTFNVTEEQAANLASAAASRVATAGTRPQMVTIKDPVSGKTVTIPATSLPSFFPRRVPGAGGATETLASIKLQAWAKYLRDPDSLAPQERRLIGVDTGKPNAELQDVTAEERKARVKVNALRARLTTPRDKTEEAIIRESLAAAEAELKQWQEIRNELTRPAGMSPSIGIGYEPRGGLRAGTLGTAEQRPPGGQQVVATLPPASSVPVGTEAVDNKTGKRFRSNGKRWVAVP